MIAFAGEYQALIQIFTVVGVCWIGVFVGVWSAFYLSLAERSSYVNAFLLLIPFDVLTENPYIKLYIKNEFDYKSSNY